MAIKDGKVTVEETNDFYKMMNEEYGGNCYAVANEIFSQNTDICAFIEESSLFSKPLTVGIYRGGKMVDVLHGTVFFAKCGKINIRSLSLKDIDIKICGDMTQSHSVSTYEKRIYTSCKIRLYKQL